MENVVEIISVIFLFGVLAYWLNQHFKEKNQLLAKYYTLKDEALSLEYKNRELQHNNKVYINRNIRLSNELEALRASKPKMISCTAELKKTAFAELTEKEFDELKQTMFSKGWSACFEEMNAQPIVVNIDLDLLMDQKKLTDSKNGKNGKSKE